MLSSLFPRGSIYADIEDADARQNASYSGLYRTLDPQDHDPDELATDEYGQRRWAMNSDHQEPPSLPDPFARDQRPEQPTRGGEYDDDLAQTQAGVRPSASHQAMHEDPFEADPPDELTRTPMMGDSATAATPSDMGQEHLDGEPPSSLLFQDQPFQLREQQALSDSRMPSSPLHAEGPDHAFGTPNQRTAESVASPPHSNVPWWLRESRRDLSTSEQLPNIRNGDSSSYPVHSSLNGSRNISLKSEFGAANRHLSDLLPTPFSTRHGRVRLESISTSKDRALWRWLNVEDFDSFLQDVYEYYVKKGFWSIVITKSLDLVTIAFVIAFAIFLTGCIDYSIIRQSHSLSQVIVPKCVSSYHGSTLLMVLVAAAIYTSRIISFGIRIQKLREMQAFYHELLEIKEVDVPTTPWPVIVERLSALREAHPAYDRGMLGVNEGDGGQAAAKLDAHDIANRIMRRDNYLIALFNKNVLDLRVPIPRSLQNSPFASYILPALGIGDTGDGASHTTDAQQSALTKCLEWSLTFCLLGFVFGTDGHVRRVFVQETNRAELISALKRRYILMGCLNAMFAPFILLYLVFYSFFRYFEEYHKNPSTIGSRTYTQMARWKFREFNELPHLFQQRLYRSYPLAGSYINQFPKDSTAQIARFVAFIAGSFASVLVLFSLLDPDAFLHFEISKDRSVLFYIGVFGSILAVARGMVPDDHRVVDPEKLMLAVIEETHYLPAEWRGKLHSADVHRAFSLLFPLKAANFVSEIVSVLTTPLILWHTLPQCAPAVIDFFRDFTVHVDGLGYVCSFAHFDFERHGDTRFGAPVQGREGMLSNQGKLEKSVLNFRAANPNWQPQDPATSLYISRVMDTDSSANRKFRSALNGSRARWMDRHKLQGRHYASIGESVISEEDLPSSGTARAAKGSFDHTTESIVQETGLGDAYISSMRPQDERFLSPPEPREATVMGLLREGVKQRSQW